ncbi:MAG: hypothetical protein ACOH19_17470 [Rhodoglobus sp.]
MGRRSSENKSNRKWWIIGSAAAVVILGVTAVGIAVVNVPEPKPLEREGLATTVVKVDPAVKSVNLPATFDAWSTNPAVGDGVQADASESGLSARFVVGAATPIMSQVVTVEPNASYTVSATYLSGAKDEGVASIALGADAPVDLATAGEWTTVNFDYKNAGESQVTLTLQSTGALDGFLLGRISLKSAADAEVITNPDFDVFAAATRITNSSLFMATRSAYLGVSAPVSSVSWSVAGSSGAEVLAGTSPAQAGLSLIQLSTLKQGFYSVTLSAPEPGLPAGKVSLVVLDDVVPDLLDERLGTIVHLSTEHSKGAEVLTQTLGLGTVRVDASWYSNEVAEGVYSFPEYLDKIYADYRARGIHLLPIAAYGNNLYDDNKTPSSPRGLAAYGKYVAAVVDHYDVDAINIYNEFNHQFNSGTCGFTPECYMGLLVPSYEAVKALDPSVLVVGPENAHKDDAFLTGLYQAGGLNYLDVVSFHPYDYGFEENGSPEFLVESLAQAQARILEYNTDDTPPPIWITELGWTSVLTDSDGQQGDFLARAEIISLASGAGRFYWYDMINDAESPADNISNYGMVHQPTASVPTWEPKPAAAAQAIVSRMLAGKSFTAQDDIAPDVYSYRFGEGDEAVTAAWSLNPVSVSYQAKGPVLVTNVTGESRVEEPVDGIVTIELGPSPVFLDAIAETPSLAG